MALDTRITIIAFFFYLLFTFLNWSESSVFIPPVIFEPFILGGITLVFFILSIRSYFSAFHLFMAAAFLTQAFVSPANKNDLSIWYSMALLLPLVSGVAAVAHSFIFWNSNSKSEKWLWVFYFILLLTSLLPVTGLISGAWSLVAGGLQALTGIALVSVPGSVLIETGWKKRIVLTLVLLTFFDIMQYFMFLSLQQQML